MEQYSFRLLRYAPNLVNGEFFNIAVLLYDGNGRIVDARFTPDFRRMRCNPAVSISLLEETRNEFEDHRLLGENFTGYAARMLENLDNRLQVSNPFVVFADDATAEIERLVRVYVATPEPIDEGRAEPAKRLGGRRLVRMRMTEAFARLGLFRNGHGMQRDVEVRYGEARRTFCFDFRYFQPTKEERFVQAVGLRRAKEDADRLTYILKDYRRLNDNSADLTVVAEDALGNDVRDIFAAEGFATVSLSAIDGYAESIKAELGL